MSERLQSPSAAAVARVPALPLYEAGVSVDPPRPPSPPPPRPASPPRAASPRPASPTRPAAGGNAYQVAAERPAFARPASPPPQRSASPIADRRPPAGGAPSNDQAERQSRPLSPRRRAEHLHTAQTAASAFRMGHLDFGIANQAARAEMQRRVALRSEMRKARIRERGAQTTQEQSYMSPDDQWPEYLARSGGNNLRDRDANRRSRTAEGMRRAHVTQERIFSQPMTPSERRFPSPGRQASGGDADGGGQQYGGGSPGHQPHGEPPVVDAYGLWVGEEVEQQLRDSAGVSSSTMGLRRAQARYIDMDLARAPRSTSPHGAGGPTPDVGGSGRPQLSPSHQEGAAGLASAVLFKRARERQGILSSDEDGAQVPQARGRASPTREPAEPGFTPRGSRVFGITSTQAYEKAFGHKPRAKPHAQPEVGLEAGVSSQALGAQATALIAGMEAMKPSSPPKCPASGGVMGTEVSTGKPVEIASMAPKPFFEGAAGMTSAQVKRSMMRSRSFSSGDNRKRSGKKLSADMKDMPNRATSPQQRSAEAGDAANGVSPSQPHAGMLSTQLTQHPRTPWEARHLFSEGAGMKRATLTRDGAAYAAESANSAGLRSEAIFHRSLEMAFEGGESGKGAKAPREAVSSDPNEGKSDVLESGIAHNLAPTAFEGAAGVNSRKIADFVLSDGIADSSKKSDSPTKIRPAGSDPNGVVTRPVVSAAASVSRECSTLAARVHERIADGSAGKPAHDLAAGELADAFVQTRRQAALTKKDTQLAAQGLLQVPGNPRPDVDLKGSEKAFEGAAGLTSAELFHLTGLGAGEYLPDQPRVGSPPRVHSKKPFLDLRSSSAVATTVFASHPKASAEPVGGAERGGAQRAAELATAALESDRYGMTSKAVAQALAIRQHGRAYVSPTRGRFVRADGADAATLIYGSSFGSGGKGGATGFGSRGNERERGWQPRGISPPRGHGGGRAESPRGERQPSPRGERGRGPGGGAANAAFKAFGEAIDGAAGRSSTQLHASRGGRKHSSHDPGVFAAEGNAFFTQPEVVNPDVKMHANRLMARSPSPTFAHQPQLQPGWQPPPRPQSPARAPSPTFTRPEPAVLRSSSSEIGSWHNIAPAAGMRAAGGRPNFDSAGGRASPQLHNTSPGTRLVLA